MTTKEQTMPAQEECTIAKQMIDKGSTDGIETWGISGCREELRKIWEKHGGDLYRERYPNGICCHEWSPYC